MAVSTHNGDFHVTGNLTCGGDLPTYPRSRLEQEGSMIQPLPITDWSVFDAFATRLAVTALSADDLSLVGGTFGTDAPFISTLDVKGVGCTKRARILFQLPCEYVTGASLFIRAFAGMKGVVSDGACTIDFSAYKLGITTNATLVDGGDLVTTAATNIKFLSWANYDFAINPSGLVAGDWLDIQMTIVVVDAATPTAVIAGCRPSMAVTIKG
jgi:hypothetical protein